VRVQKKGSAIKIMMLPFQFGASVLEIISAIREFRAAIVGTYLLHQGYVPGILPIPICT